MHIALACAAPEMEAKIGFGLGKARHFVLRYRA